MSFPNAQIDFLLPWNDDCRITIPLSNVVHRLKTKWNTNQVESLATKQYRSLHKTLSLGLCCVKSSGFDHNRHLWIIIFLNGFWCSFSASSAKLYIFHKFFQILIPSVQRTESSCSADKANWKLCFQKKKANFCCSKIFIYHCPAMQAFPKIMSKARCLKAFSRLWSQ